MLTSATIRRIKAAVLEDFDVRAKCIYTSATAPRAAFVELADGGLVRVELVADLPTALVNNLPANAVFVSASASAADRRQWMDLPGYVVLD